jgi:SNF2 family DNA or RNA helicase
MLLRGDAAVSFAERLARFRGELVGDALEGFRRADPLVPRLEIQGADFALRFESALDGAPKSAAAERVLRAWRNGESLVALDGGGFAPLPADWLALHGERIADLLAARSAARSGSLPRCALPDLARLCDEIGEPRPAEADALRRRLEQRGGASGPELPGDLRATLRRYQREGVAWLGLLRDAELGALLADDMGLGKTLQALCALRGRTLVVAPTSVLHNWRDEIARFRPGLRCSLYHGPGRRLSPRADVTLTSYAILRLDAESLAAQRWDSVILDEAQIIKNPDSQVARAAYRLLGTRRDFDERVGRPVAAGDEPAVARLRERTRPFLLRRLKRDVAPELPPRTDIVLHAVLDEEERHTYEAIRAATRRDVVERLAAGSGVLQALEALLRLRQAACHRALVPGQRAASSSKLELLLEMLDEVVAEGHKALVFSQWTKLLDLVEPRLGESGLPFARLDGSTRDRAGVVARFQDEAGPPVMLVSLTAGGLGLNLTAADHVFILDPWWNPAVEDQAADRAHRIGQDRPVMVYRLVAEQTVEERVLALQQRKREIAEAAVGAGGRAGAITRHELLELLA